MATGSMGQIESEIQGGSSGVGKETGGSIRTNPVGMEPPSPAVLRIRESLPRQRRRQSTSRIHEQIRFL